jgi:hypothetical protein
MLHHAEEDLVRMVPSVPARVVRRRGKASAGKVPSPIRLTLQLRAMARGAAVRVSGAALGDDGGVIGITQRPLRPGLPDSDRRRCDERSGAGQPDRRQLHRAAAGKVRAAIGGMR